MEDLKKYCRTNDVEILRLLSPEIKKNLLEYAPKTIEKYGNNNNNIYVLRAKEIIDILTTLEQGDPTKCIKLNPLKWTGNSCYIDSVLFALLAVPTQFSKKYIFESELQAKENDLDIRRNIQRELIRIGRHIRGYEQMKDNTCKDLRKSLKYYPHPEEFHGTDMADAGEFLTYILDIFDLNVARSYFVNYATNNVTDARPPVKDLVKISTSYDDHSSIVRYVTTENIESLDQYGVYDIRNFLSLKDDSGELDINNLYTPENSRVSFSRKISYNVLLDAPYIIFRIDRQKHTFDDIEFLDVSILPSQTLTIHSNIRFVLSAIVVFEGAHYTCYFYNCGNWFYYDDMPRQKITLIGSYEDMIKSSPSPLQNGTLYFYNSM